MGCTLSGAPSVSTSVSSLSTIFGGTVKKLEQQVLFWSSCNKYVCVDAFINMVCRTTRDAGIDIRCYTAFGHLFYLFAVYSTCCHCALSGVIFTSLMFAVRLCVCLSVCLLQLGSVRHVAVTYDSLYVLTTVVSTSQVAALSSCVEHSPHRRKPSGRRLLYV